MSAFDHMRQMVERELGESLVAKLVSSTSWKNLRPATSRGSATGAKQLLPWIATPPPTILTSSPSRSCSWSMLSVQDYCSPIIACYRFAKYHTRYQKPKNISGLPSSNNSVAFEEKWDGIICLLGRSRGEDNIFNRSLNTILLRIRELHLKRVFAHVLFR